MISSSIVSHDKITASVSFWDQAYVFAIIVPTSNLTALSSQIIAGVDPTNIAVASQHYVSTQTDENGTSTFSFTLLSDETNYTIFVSAQCVLPYTPRVQLGDNETLSLNVTTQVNLNLMKNQDRAK